MKIKVVNRVGLVALLAVSFACAWVWQASSRFAVYPQDTHVAGNSKGTTTIAFVGDHGAKQESRDVFNLIKRKGADLLVTQGDFGYGTPAHGFDVLLDATLGPDFPIIVALGNHDWPEKDQYQTIFQDRLKRTPEVICKGDIGIDSLCSFRGIDVISTTPGLSSDYAPDDTADAIGTALTSSNAKWKICNWHKNQTALQLGKKRNDVGWQPYETCRKHGAMIVTAHEHSYSRTFPITQMGDTLTFSKTNPDVAKIHPGQTIAIVSGLGGASVRRQRRSAPWWASVYTKDQNAKPGALFCTFSAEPVADRAECRFVNIDNELIDEFQIQIGKGSDAAT